MTYGGRIIRESEDTQQRAGVCPSEWLSPWVGPHSRPRADSVVAHHSALGVQQPWFKSRSAHLDRMAEQHRKKRIVVAGSRSITDPHAVYPGMTQITAGGVTRGKYEVVSGNAEGVDQSGIKWANEYDCDVTLFDPYNAEETKTEYPYDVYGNRAFVERNREMVEYGDILVAVWDGNSSGTHDIILKALDEGIDTHVFIREPEE